jgi:hypothetical protein
MGEQFTAALGEKVVYRPVGGTARSVGELVLRQAHRVARRRELQQSLMVALTRWFW